MTQSITAPEGTAERKTQKRAEKKNRIAQSAIGALKNLGYAKTSLRDIAANSDLSLGMLHYYFEDKVDLIIYCVQIYKAEFIQTTISALQSADGRDEIITAFSGSLADSILDDWETHRLWYDIRSQAMFDPIFVPAVREIEAELIRVVALGADALGSDVPAHTGYGAIDGLFRHFVQNFAMGQFTSRARVQTDFEALLGKIYS